MGINVSSARKSIQAFNLQRLFVEELGWDRHSATLEITINGGRYTLGAMAEKRGMVAFVCEPTDGAETPTYAQRRHIDRLVAKTHFEHLIVYVDAEKTTQIWQWVKREHGRPAASREHTWHKSQPGDALLQKLDNIRFTLEEEESIGGIGDVTSRVRAGFDLERVTKRFYDRFKTEHDAFLRFIKGIPEEEMHRWYVSVMLNRLMFIYFIQKKGFLDGDRSYLRTKLNASKQAGKDRFYRAFLCPLFFEGFAIKEEERSAETNELLGKVPYLNGGLFLRHQIEEHCGEKIQVADAAFARIFDFFDAYQWHLDERPLRQDDEINPDVLGYIFEKYVNQKQMGAYYTKEDITEYIAKNTIIPFLFDEAKKECPIAFPPDSFLWKLLSEDPNRYIHDAVRKGVIDKKGAVLPLPPEIEAGVNDIGRRGGWNKPADDIYALPTETWREHVARRQRCLELRRKLRDGEVHDINDFITLNLDIRQFAQDVIVNSEGPELVRAFYQAIENITVLDPTCGSGAFLFAALNVLQPLYEACLERMGAFLSEANAGKGGMRPERFADFRRTLERIKLHPSHDYFVLKSILVSNLYGVDIMEEAVEICKLRLFLKLVAQLELTDKIEPLPDIDFNIRPGNTLVGYAAQADAENNLNFGDSITRIIQKASEVDRRYQDFRQRQTGDEWRMSSKLTLAIKQAMLKPMAELRQELDQFLAVAHGHAGKGKFEAWRKSHQPFHWFSEFYGIVKSGGFNVIIGNPPYISAAEVRKSYTVKGYETAKCSDIYANVQERCLALLADGGRCGMIVPLSIGFSSDFQLLRNLLFRRYSRSWFSSFGRIPAALFSADVRVRNTIHLGSKHVEAKESKQYTTVLHRWFEAYRPFLMSNIRYAKFDPPAFKGLVPKINSQALSDAMSALVSRSRSRLDSALAHKPTKHVLHFKKSAYNWLNFCRSMPPCYDADGKPISHTKFGDVWFTDAESRDLAYVFLNGKIMFAYWCMVGDDFDLTRWMFADFPLDLDVFTEKQRHGILSHAQKLEECMRSNLTFKLNAGKRVGNYNLARCRGVTDAADALFASALGLSAVMQDIELLYSQVVKTDFSDAAENED